ncbi:G-type lectin S-receptor-like serine/threonine-protein kinase LECRK3 [Pyrus communis]|uniref:G-type lectin S-receptor-like serine/threonine-protein kinase LECRK3 n=1 Tax=Pyrus communis TaxID=23211 RepID=UPI0035C1ACAB
MACPLINLPFFFLFMFLPFSTLAQTSKNISLGSSLTALNDDNSSSWTSPSGDFAFGFQRIGKDGFLLAIWFDKIKDKTIVWSANGDNLVPGGSKVELSNGGEFMLNDATGKRIWSAQSIGLGVAYASMLDTGNFVLADRSSSNVWESFGEPTDTILPAQILNQNDKLFARYTATNYSRGRFMFSLQSDGNLTIYTTKFPLETNNFAYYATSTNTGFQVIFNQSGYLYLTARNGSVLNMISSNTISTQNFYHKVTLEHDGVLRHSAHPKTAASSAGSPMAWSPLTSEPSNICLTIEGDAGSGACGYNSLCSYNDEGPACQCPYGYTLIDPNDVLKGCKQNFVSQSCDEASPETESFEFREMQNTEWSGGGYEQFTPVDEDWCRQNCFDDCFCAVAIFKNGECEKKRIPLSNGRMDPNVGGKALIKVRKDNYTLIPEVPNTKKKDRSTLILIGSVLLSSSGFLNLILLLTTYLIVFRIAYRKAKLIQPYRVISDMNLRHFTYEELKNATNEFEEELGRGTSAIVFKGVLAPDNGKSVAVKSLVARVGENDLEFKAEVSAIGRTNHRNLVQLLGFCYGGEHQMLVYEFMSNGSLASFLFGELRPSWCQRRQIALGIARGLLYLHEECSRKIVHCDIKPQNILLDDSFAARISDFGLAKLLKIDQTLTTTGIRGTKGYVAPEWLNRLPITAKVDIYSYGILLLEIIFCRKHFEAAAEDEDQMILADWAYDCYKQNNLHQLFKNDHEAMHDVKKMEKYVMIAIWCIQEDPSLRPTMKKVALMLEGTVEVSAPPDPCSFISSIL